MEVTETAACGITVRLFALKFEGDEITQIYRLLLYAQQGKGFYDEDFLEDVISQLTFVVGPSILEPVSGPPAETNLKWEDAGMDCFLIFNEIEAGKLHEILNGVKHPGEGFDREMNQTLLDEMLSMRPTQLENLLFIMR
jgi:hypothetical protein